VARDVGVIQSQWPHGLRHVQSSSTWTLGSCVQILLETWMCVYTFFCIVLSCVGSGLAMDWSPVQGVLPNVQKWIHKFQKSNYELEKARGHNPNLLLDVGVKVQFQTVYTLLSKDQHINFQKQKHAALERREKVIFENCDF